MDYGQYIKNPKVIPYSYFLYYSRRAEQKNPWEEFNRLSEEIIKQQEEEGKNKQNKSVLNIVYSVKSEQQKHNFFKLNRKFLELSDDFSN
jgi:hypothetical protein